MPNDENLLLSLSELRGDLIEEAQEDNVRTYFEEIKKKQTKKTLRNILSVAAAFLLCTVITVSAVTAVHNRIAAENTTDEAVAESDSGIPRKTEEHLENIGRKAEEIVEWNGLTMFSGLAGLLNRGEFDRYGFAVVTKSSDELISVLEKYEIRYEIRDSSRDDLCFFPTSEDMIHISKDYKGDCVFAFISEDEYNGKVIYR